jgi:hypothetical protein
MAPPHPARLRRDKEESLFAKAHLSYPYSYGLIKKIGKIMPIQSGDNSNAIRTAR